MIPRIAAAMLAIAALTAATAMIGCASSTRGGEPGAPDVFMPTENLPPISDELYAGPDATVQVLTRQYGDQARSVAVVEVIARTGGHRLTLDAAAVRNGTAQLFVTLERPGAGEIVTQALVPLHVSFESAGERFDRAKAYVRSVRRDDPDSDTGYRLAATAR